MSFGDWFRGLLDFDLGKPEPKPKTEKKTSTPAKQGNDRGLIQRVREFDLGKDDNSRASSGPFQGVRNFDLGNSRPPLQQRRDPLQSTRATQRYLSSAGWGGTLAAPNSSSQGVDQGSIRYIGEHQYGLTPWQQEQAEYEYGVKVPDREVKLKGDRFRTGQMNLADYESLTPQQKNAVRFNELLLAATEADRRAKVAPENQSADYQGRVAEMFGTQGGSNVYAPNTLNLLDKMGMGRLRGQDLDEYLSLDRAYDVGEIQALQPWDITPEATEYGGFGQARSIESQGILDQRQIDNAGSLIEKALADTSTRGWNENARISNYLGNRPPVDQIPFGWLQEGESRDEEGNKKEELFQNMYDYLSSGKAENLDEFWAATEARNFTDADYTEIYDYFHLRSLEDDRMGVPAGYRTGQQTRDFIGLGG